MDQAILVALVMLVCVLTMLVLGIPISISIGLASTIAMLFVLPFENAMGTAAQKVFTGVNSFSLLAIPFFILAGNIMDLWRKKRVTQRIIWRLSILRPPPQEC